jgi:stage V sporulation protein B
MSATESPDDTRSAEGAARESARGAAFISLAKVWFMATGFLQPLVLTRLLGTEGYGLYALALSAVSILNNVVVTGSIQAMSRAVIQEGTPALRRGLTLHAALGALLAASLALGAGVLGETVLKDSRLPSLLRIGAIIVADYSVYAALVGALNGRRRFATQAALDMTFSTLRSVLVLGLAATGLRVLGAVAGFAAASALIVLLALLVSRGDLRGSAPTSAEPFGVFVRRYAGFFAPVLLYQLGLNLVLQVDGLVFKALMARRGLTEDAVNTLVGVYKAVQNFAFLPYQLLLAVTFVVFPLVSKATLEGDRDAARRSVESAMRFSALAAGLMLAVLAGVPRGVLRLAYRAPFDDGAAALRTLALGQGAFSLTVIGCTIILAAGRTRVATMIMTLTLAAVLVGDALGVGASPSDVRAVEGLALGTAIGWCVGIAATGWYLRAEFGAFLRAATALRVVLSTATAALAAGAMPWSGKLGTVLTACCTGVVYLAMLVLTGELTRIEVLRIGRAVQRR